MPDALHFHGFTAVADMADKAAEQQAHERAYATMRSRTLKDLFKGRKPWSTTARVAMFPCRTRAQAARVPHHRLPTLIAQTLRELSLSI